MAQYKVRAQFRRKRTLTESRRRTIQSRDDWVCQYCGEPSESVDHIIPWSYGGSDDDDNLVASCLICNMIAGNFVFDTFDLKRAYILDRLDSWIARHARRMRKLLSFCPDCSEIFIPNVDGATAVLCAVCFQNDENGENGAIRPELAS